MPVRLEPPALPDWERAFKAVQEQAGARGLRAWVVGGYVRDRLLDDGRDRKIREVDILVAPNDEGPPFRSSDTGVATQLATAVGTALKVRPPVIFERFGTAHLDIDRDHALEFVAPRVETYDPNSRKPTVSPGSLKDDVLRRDFTVNTLLMDWDGTVLDLTGRGLEDLKGRRIVTPLDPQATFDEDPLRMLRAVRFATTLEFTVEPSVEDAIRKHADRLQPPVVSMERIRDEFSKLLLAAELLPGLQLLDRTGLLVRILPQLEAGKGMQQGGWHSHDVFGHSLLTSSLTPPELITRVAGLLHDVGKPARHELRNGKPTFIGHQEVGATMAGSALRRLRYPGDFIDAVTRLIRLHMRPIQYDPQGWEDKAVRRLVRDAGDQLDRLLALARADMRASHYPDVKKVDDLEARIRRLDAEAIAAIRSPLTGDELMARTGRPAGPWIKRAKAALEDAIVDGTLQPDPDSAWQYLQAHPELLQS
ncbi:MAG TPA: HD domain-containing protein [Candidatus Acidoferrum sp.]|nr:HD domain-containing protein [Candidatus Acidoferrum sp.]